MNTFIFSQDTDLTTNKVMDWLHFHGATVTRVNGEAFGSENCQVSLKLTDHSTEHSLIVDGVDVLQAKVNRLWIRRDSPSSACTDFKYEDKGAESQVQRHLQKESREAKRSLFRMLNLPVLGDFFQMNVEKTDILMKARSTGLQIPATLITSRKSDLLTFIKEHGSVITKPLVDPIHVQPKKQSVFLSYTEALDKKRLAAIPEQFFVSLFQEQIEKAYELRIFFLDNRCYPMAIFSQLDQQTTVDFRRYNTKKSNRNVPYKLPEKIEASLVKLMNDIGLNTGSIDIIRAVDGRYVFLEVNPVGQFGMVSGPCNYYLEEQVALSLIKDTAAPQINGQQIG